MKKIFLGGLRIYQFLFSAEKGALGLRKRRTCVFYPSCSEYSRQAVSKHGILKGCWLSLKRLSKCHPWQKNYYDPIT